VEPLMSPAIKIHICAPVRDAPGDYAEATFARQPTTASPLIIHTKLLHRRLPDLVFSSRLLRSRLFHHRTCARRFEE
jgi:hypothetical protein